MEPAGPLYPLFCGRNLRCCTARTVQSLAGLFPNAFPSGTGQLSAVHMSLHFPRDSHYRRRRTSTPGSAGAVTSQSHLWFHQDSTPPGESEGTHRLLLGWSPLCPSAPPRSNSGCHRRGLSGCRCRLGASPPLAALAGSPLRWVTGLPRRFPGRIPESAVALVRRPWHKGAVRDPGTAGGPRGCRATLLGPPGGEARESMGRQLHLLPQFPSSCSLGEARLPVRGL